MRWLILVLLSGVANASPFYFETTLGGAGSPSRGLQNTTAGIAFGANLFETGPITWSAEIGYTHIGTTSGKKYMVPQQVALSSVPPFPPVVVEDPDVPPPVIVQPPAPPPILVKAPEPAPAPRIIKYEPVPPPIMVEIPDVPPPVIIQQPVPDPLPIVIIDVPPVIVKELAETVTAQAMPKLPGGIKMQVPAITKRFPRWDTDIYRVSGGGTIKFGRIQININAGAEKAVKDGTVMEKVEKNELINWNNGEKFRTDEWSPVFGGAVLFQFNKQLLGVAKIDYHDHNNGEKGTQTDDIIVSVGFRFPI